MFIENKLFLLFIIIVILCIGIGIRLYYADLSEYNINCDTSTVGIMAFHILQGETPLFFYGQEYLGPFEALVIALFFIVFGISNHSMFLAMIFLSVLFLISLYFLTREFGNRRAGIVALVFCAVAPAYFIQHNVLPLGYHVEILFMGNILFILTFKIIRNNRLFYYILAGLIAGFAFWTHYIILYYLVPIAVFLLINKRWKDLVKFGPISLCCFFIGGFPFWIYTVTHNFGTFGFPPSEKGNFFLVIKDVFLPNFAALFSLRWPFFCRGHGLDTIVFLIYLGSFLYFLYMMFKRSKHLLLIVFFVSIVMFFGIYNYHALKGCAYYIIPLYSLVPVVFGYMISRIMGRYGIFGIGILVFVLVFNGYGIYEFFKSEKDALGLGNKLIPEKINFLRENDINRIICDMAEDYTIQFLTEEEIIITGCGGSEYMPYNFIIESADTVAVGRFGINALPSVVKDYQTKYDICYDIKPYGYELKEILPDKWHVDTDYSKETALYAFDRNYSKRWSSIAARKTGMYFTIDLGKSYEICKFQIFNHDHLYNFPMSCRVEVSMDAENWTQVKYIECIEPLFWSGPRLYWHLIYGRWEVVFDPVIARYLRLVQEGCGAPHPWEINEIFVYESIGEKDIDYTEEAKKIYQFVVNEGFSSVYADFWLSAKIRLFSEDNIDTVRPFSGNSPGFTEEVNITREAELKQDMAFIIEKENEDEFNKIISEFQLPLVKREFSGFICYYFDKWQGTYLEELEDESWLYWIGIGLVKYNLKEYSNLLFQYASSLENKGEYKGAVEYYKKSIEYYLNNLGSHLGLIRLYKELGLNAERQKCRDIFKHRFLPKIKKQAAFKNNIDFYGFNINNDVFKPADFIKIDYFWKVNTKEIPSGLVVFVHFIKDEKICFQNDHIFLSRYHGSGKVFKEEVFRESFKVDIPWDLVCGEYEIYIGLYEPHNGRRVPLKLNPKQDKIKIGVIKII